MVESSARIVIGIDASNIREGGGVTHLMEMLGALPDLPRDVDRVIIWAEPATIAKLPKRDWLCTVAPDCLQKGPLGRLFWQCLGVALEAKRFRCAVLLVPGGSYIGTFRPFVTMSRNMLPFDDKEIARYSPGRGKLRLRLLRWVQSYTFRRSDAVVFLTDFARNAVLRHVGSVSGRVATIPHGVSARFKVDVREAKPIAAFSERNPFVIVYVSQVLRYKHQWHVVEALARVRDETGWPLEVNFIGGSPDAACAERLAAAIRSFDPSASWCRQLGHASHEKMHELLASADLAVFASSCENMPNILLEKMAAGLPIACSHRGPMPECLGGAGVLFDPEDPIDIAAAIKALVGDERRRYELGDAARKRAGEFTWAECAASTFGLLAQVAKGR